jgi:prophage tail gpP-like protein
MIRPDVPNPAEVATIVAGGVKYDDWATVMVEDRYGDAYPRFNFTAVERDPDATNWTTLRFKPGDDCAIYLGGVLAIVGVILTRQVAYDGDNHQVQLQGNGQTWYASKSSIIDEKSNFDGMTFEQVARKVIAPFGVDAKVIGTLESTPFKNLQVEPGELLWDFLERIARPKGIVIGSDHLGAFLLIGEHSVDVVDSLVEGDNIKSCQCVITVDSIHSEYWLRGQSQGTDDHAGADASQQEARVAGTAKRYSPLLTTAEQPVWSQAELQDRARNEAVWHEGSVLSAYITVQGWFRRSGALWRAGESVSVKSPMALLDQVMSIQSVTYTQADGAGTTAVLECVPPFLLRGTSEFTAGQDGAPQDPRTYETGKPAEPATKVPDPPPLKLD